jgi:two-component system phosphate regulon sensor histidine kinase PhoR
MNNYRIRAVVILGVISILCILSIQVFWIKKNIDFQQKSILIQNRQDSVSSRQFNEKISIALLNTAIEIQCVNHSTSDLYGAVKQQTSNYFTVELEDTLHPNLLERILKTEFYNQNIREDFRYGIYDCFSDSIVYGNYIRFVNDSIFVTQTSKEKEESTTKKNLQEKLNTDVHYFSVVFPNRVNQSIESTPDTVTSWYYLFAIAFLVLGFFIYTLNIILKQKKLSDIKTDFINNMTHELKTPISTIRLSSETLLSEYESMDSEKLLRYSSIIYKENKRLEHQVERVLNVAKLDKGEVKFENTVFNIHEVIEEAKDNLEYNQLEELKGKINLELNAQNSLVYGDEVHITNVIYNLLDNAIKYCTKAPIITINSDSSKHKFQLTVSDNGKGISKDNQKYLFDKFYRVPTGNLHDVKGFGLGLFYVKSIVEKMNGEVNVKSVLGKGSSFTITLPLNNKPNS